MTFWKERAVPPRMSKQPRFVQIVKNDPEE
jgi:hypothetical protein